VNASPHIFGVRHVSPAAAWHLRQLLDRVAEAISLLANSMALSGNFGDGAVSDRDLASGLQGAVIKDDEKDVVVWKDYLANVMKKRGASWRELFTACQEHVGE
jgi:hypothetical protein